MNELLKHIQLKTSIDSKDIALLERLFVFQEMGPNTLLSNEGKVERYVYYLNKGIIRGYHNCNGKIVVEQLVGAGDFSKGESLIEEIDKTLS